MKVLRGPYTEWEAPDSGTALTVGVFDGVHRGHQAILQRAEDLGAGRPTVVVTFVPHPAVVLAPERAPRLLTTPDQRLRQFVRLGVDIVAFLDFAEEMRNMPPEQFVSDVLVGGLRAEVIVVGRDFRFGKDRRGDVALLADLAPSLGYTFEAMDLLGGEDPVSSTAIRRRLSEGDLDGAKRLLGRPYAVEGTVVEGAGRGRRTGVSTANLGLDPDQFIPARGVYAVLVRVHNRTLTGVCNVGVRPTFGDSGETIEVHILGFHGDVLGERLEVEFHHRIRDEREFRSADELSAQIHMDINVVAAVLGTGDAAP